MLSLTFASTKPQTAGFRSLNGWIGYATAWLGIASWLAWTGSRKIFVVTGKP
jgi:hypothetical protein